jgi:dCTP deaminase
MLISFKQLLFLKERDLGMVKNDKWIREMAYKGMIEPFDKKQVKKGVISYGVSSYGYDMRVADEFKIFSSVNSTFVDPKKPDETSFIDYKEASCIIPPNSFVLGRSLEYFRIPREVLVICLGKSTYARCGIIINITPLEPEWEGYITMSISNTGPLPAKIYSNEGIAQLIFIQASELCEISYADKKGKYQAQKKITLARIK